MKGLPAAMALSLSLSLAPGTALWAEDIAASLRAGDGAARDRVEARRDRIVRDVRARDRSGGSTLLGRLFGGNISFGAADIAPVTDKTDPGGGRSSPFRSGRER